MTAPKVAEAPARKGLLSGLGGPGVRAKLKVTGAKKDLTDGFNMAYGIAGGAVLRQQQKAGRSGVPGAIMQYQAKAGTAGRELNKWVRSHDIAYAILAPIFGAGGIDMLSTVAGPPLLAFIAESKPDLWPMLEPMFAPMMYDLFLDLKKAEAKQGEIMAELAERMQATGAMEGEEPTVIQNEFQAFLAQFRPRAATEPGSNGQGDYVPEEPLPDLAN